MQGFNKYYPPDYDGKTSVNKLAGKNHALGSRASKIKDGILTVRFECPFDISCLKCEKTIAQGVRFNASKKKVGNYYTTPIWSFRMKCANCANWLEIRTNPKDTTYDVVEGAKKLFTTLNAESPASGVVKIGDDTFGQIEKNRSVMLEKERNDQIIRGIYQANKRQWNNAFESSQKLRKAFRTEKKAIQANENAKRAVSDKNSLHIPLLDVDTSDKSTAKVIKYGSKLEEDAQRSLDKRLHSSAFTANGNFDLGMDPISRALSTIASLVDKKSDSFDISSSKVRKKRVVSVNKPKSVQPELKDGKSTLVEYSDSSDES
ncbi:hypothetical protein D0Z00_000832 [Geotrichum galactomycetum]|uniref:Uncharacterized protein n=1 Tax=Geotrichum galactomycetum TaxID=27317 RepID=A0ACB6V8T2_9ASCO|nr:hypothetical protein D0Z00_000832 [Geotrichum candidum]